MGYCYTLTFLDYLIVLVTVVYLIFLVFEMFNKYIKDLVISYISEYLSDKQILDCLNNKVTTEHDNDKKTEIDTK